MSVRSFLLKLVMLIAMSFPFAASAETDEIEGQTNSQSTANTGLDELESLKPPVKDDEISKNEDRDSNKSTNSLLQPTDINRQNISTAIERFRPTEEISADNAVPFPVDI